MEGRGLADRHLSSANTGTHHESFSIRRDDVGSWRDVILVDVLQQGVGTLKRTVRRVMGEQPTFRKQQLRASASITDQQHDAVGTTEGSAISREQKQQAVCSAKCRQVAPVGRLVRKVAEQERRSCQEDRSSRPQASQEPRRQPWGSSNEHRRSAHVRDQMSGVIEKR